MMILKRIEVKAEWWAKEVRSMRCCVPGCLNDGVEFHHLLKMRWRDDMGTPLCKHHHTFAKNSIHIMGDISFMAFHGFNIYEYWLKVLMPQYEQMKANR